MATIQRTGGRIIPSSGPRVVAAYDAVSTAVAAALRIQARPTDGLVSVGLAAGDVVWRGDDCAGAPIDAAVELASLAPAGQIIVSDTVRLLTDRPPHATYEPLDESGTAADPERPSGAMLLRATGSAEPDGSHGGEPPGQL
jgi:class 3 adenylate cyclase